MKVALVFLSLFTINSWAQNPACSDFTVEQIAANIHSYTPQIIDESILACKQQISSLDQILSRESNIMVRANATFQRTSAYYNLGFILGWKNAMASIKK